MAGRTDFVAIHSPLTPHRCPWVSPSCFARLSSLCRAGVLITPLTGILAGRRGTGRTTGQSRTGKPRGSDGASGGCEWQQNPGTAFH
ncbi:hypothetical protein BEI59_11500 [Eisenbergiella tayi]|uniref:Uncharacterized protein n=1 Tax=Eisenbergiella tayi TaxID=1432052 RepID=A0A1E3UIL8_9FIRM|nr:hypothetical protein BEI62_00980 [Eisenbergiella tayi]ODR52133.1 hypothetical protein BEI59_11500 [Eisenbergiella tayi]ODR54674.1 hypothetical protein BEI63_17190 [Eisenbergiella tayi]CUQ07256.1 Uncharacterised protein [Fusicatenibacter sp. 2789STDY5834925]